MSPDINALIEHHKRDCNLHAYGHCHTNRCMRRGGWVAGNPVNYDVATCEAHETVLALQADDALKQERREICQMIEAEARRHDDEAQDLRDHYEHADIAEEAWLHQCDAATLRSIADKIRARTPAEPAEAEIKF